MEEVCLDENAYFENKNNLFFKGSGSSSRIIGKVRKQFFQPITEEEWSTLCQEVKEEFKVLGEYDCHNVAKVLGIWQKPSEGSKIIPHLIFEGSKIYLSEYLEKKPRLLEGKNIINIFTQVLNGLIYLESKGMNNGIHSHAIIVGKGKKKDSLNNYKVIVDKDGSGPMEAFWEELKKHSSDCMILDKCKSFAKKVQLTAIRQHFQFFLEQNADNLGLSFDDLLAFAGGEMDFQLYTILRYYEIQITCPGFGRCFSQPQVDSVFFRRLLKILKKASSKGHPAAQFCLGVLYSEEADPDIRMQGEALVIDSSIQQFTPAVSYLGHSNLRSDHKKAVQLLSLSSNKGYSKAQYWLGVCYYEGIGVEVDFKKAAQLFTLSTQCLVSNAPRKRLKKMRDLEELADDLFMASRFPANTNFYPHTNLGVCYLEGKGVEADFKKAVELFTLASNQGYPQAHSNLGACYLEGKGVEVDFKKAVELFTLASDQGVPEAHSNLGKCYFEGKGVEVDFSKAVELFTLASQGVPEAYTNLGKCYMEGKGVGVDFKKAVELFTLASNQGYPQAHSNLGVCYLGGKGVEVDLKKAVELFTLASNQGVPQGQVYLGACYLEGKGVEVDFKKAVELLTLDSNQGVPQAHISLGTCYLEGKGVEVDFKKAAELFTLASNQ